MNQQQSERDFRIQKIQKIKSLSIIPFPQKYDKQDDIQDIITKYQDKNFREIENIISNPTTQVSTAGRVILHRSHGKLLFMKLLDGTAQIQLMFHRDNCKIINDKMESTNMLKDINWEEKSAYKFAEKLVDMWDFIGIKGEVFKTHKWELSIYVSEFTFLSKAIRPLPEKFHWIQNQEAMYRQRYLDLTSNEETYQRFLLKSDFIKVLREFYRSHGYKELELPVLTSAASGAAAKTFQTHHNAFNTDFYLRICNETELKKATIWRFEKVFIFWNNFRNEGTDPSHLQEFTMLEHQSVFQSFHEDMAFTEKMFDHIFDSLKFDRVFEVKDKAWNAKTVDFTTPWKKVDYVEWVNKASGLDITKYGIDDADKLREDIKATWIEFEGMNQMWTMTLIDYLFKKVLRPSIVWPVFVYNYPRILAPLARISDDDPNKCEKRQVIVNGREIINSYWELVDPLKQKEQFIEQSKAEAWWDEEATSTDNDFVTAMEYGMPIQAWFGMWVERIFSLLTGQDNLRDVVLFPLMKPEEGDSTSKSKDTMLATILINKWANMEKREELNTVAHLTASFWARNWKKLFMQDAIETADNKQIKLNIQHAIMIKQLDSNDETRNLINEAKLANLEIAEFTQEMLKTSDDTKVIAQTKTKNREDINYMWVLIFWKRSDIDKLSKKYPLYS